MEPRFIKITVTAGQERQVKGFEDTNKGRRESMKYLESIKKEHMQNQFIQVLDVLKNRRDLILYLKREALITIPFLRVDVETITKNAFYIDDLL